MYTPLSPEDYVRCSARELGARVADGRASPVQLAELAAALAQRTEPAINAYVRFLPEYARKVAEEREREAREGRLRSPLHGVPIAIKDNFYLTGFPVTKGSRTSTDAPATYDSPMVGRIVAAGAVIIGKTTMPEFGWKGTGISPLTGVTRNPWNTERNSGGSSAGSAATVAAGAVPIALGSDAGGSVRIPASFCGVVGLKATLGRIPVWPGTVTETLSHAGPLTRTVDDARLVLQATQGPHAPDPLSYGARPYVDAARQARLRDGACRVGIVADPFDFAPMADVSGVFAPVVDRMRGTVPAAYRDVRIGQALPREVFEAMWVTGRGLGFKDDFARHAAIMDPGLVRLGPLAEAYTVAQFFKALDARRRFVAAAFALFDSVDLLVMPTMPLVAFDAASEVPSGGEASAPLPWITWTPYTYPFNISGQPAISIPGGMTEANLPVGLQVVGPWGEDDLVLDFAQQIEAALEHRRNAGFPPCLRAALAG